MKTEVAEIADKIYRLSTFVPQVGPTGFTFNQFLIDADQPLLFHYGGLDTRIDAGIPDFEAALKANNKTYEIFVYEGANHAFNNDTSAARYDKQAADLAWGRTIAFLKEKLG